MVNDDEAASGEENEVTHDDGSKNWQKGSMDSDQPYSTQPEV